MIVDSDVLIWHLRDHSVATKYLHDAGKRGPVFVSTITVAEVASGQSANPRVLEQLFTAIEPLPVTFEIAQRAGAYRQRFGPSHGVGLADCIIAATADAHELQVATLNVRHFPMIRGLKPAFKP